MCVSYQGFIKKVLPRGLGLLSLAVDALQDRCSETGRSCSQDSFKTTQPRWSCRGRLWRALYHSTVGPLLLKLLAYHLIARNRQQPLQPIADPKLGQSSGSSPASKSCSRQFSLMGIRTILAADVNLLRTSASPLLFSFCRGPASPLVPRWLA